MKHTELIDFILRELERHNVILNSYEEIHLFLLPHESYSSTYASNWSNWRRGAPQNINKVSAKRGIQESIGFESYIWDSDSKVQMHTIREAVTKLLNPIAKVDLSHLLPSNTPLSDAQGSLLLQLRKVGEDEAVSILAKSPYLKSLPENQIFLLKLLPLLFEKGMYAYLIDVVFPALLPHNAEHINVKIFKAHTYGSLPKPEYLKAVFLLNTIEVDSDDLALEIKTGMLSNLRRHTLEKEHITKAELLEALPAFIQHYTAIFENIQKHHYYPGINLGYMLTLSMYLSPLNPLIVSEDIFRIYTDAQTSIAQNSHSTSTETSYYAKMSEIEFRLLLDTADIESLLSHLLELDTPAPAYVVRTVRMMQFFVRMLERFSEVDASGLIERFQMVIGIMDIYIVENR